MTKYCLDGDYEVCTDTHTLLYKGKTQKIEPLILRLLTFMFENPDRVLTHDEIINAVWKTPVISNSALNAAVCAARHAIGDTGREQQCIKTVSGSGYRFIAEFKRIDDNRETGSSGFVIIRLHSSVKNWKPVEPTLLDQKYCQFFSLVDEYVTGADPIFDITIKNELETPIILKEIGVELTLHYENIVDGSTDILCNNDPFSRGRIPRTIKIELVDAYNIDIPDILDDFQRDDGDDCMEPIGIREDFDPFDSFDSFIDNIKPIELRRDILTLLPDPIYFEGNAVYRYSIRLKNYSQHIPIDALIRFIVESDQGRIYSHLIRMEGI